METKESRMYKVYKLFLSDRRCPLKDEVRLAAISYEKDKLIDFYENQKLDYPKTDLYGKRISFKDGPLKWFIDDERVTDNKYHGAGPRIESTWLDESLMSKIRETSVYFVE